MIEQKKYSRLIPALTAAVIGAALFIIIYGFRILIPTNVDWLLDSGDLSQHYYGWCFYRSSSWLFPIGLTDTLGYPYVTSVMFTDSIPLFAVFFKLLSPILPANFQYFGLWGIVCFMLHGAIGALICLRYTRSGLRAVLGSLLFVLSPVVLQRLYYHSALAGHWLIYLGILLLISYDTLAPKFKLALLYWGLLGALVASIHQYILPMCGVLCFGYALFELFKSKRWYGLLHCVSFIACALGVDYLLGAFSVTAHTEGGGLGNYSFNLNGLVNPQGYSEFFPNLATYNDQHEGFAYLGLGVITLCLIAFLIHLYLRERDESRTLKAALRKHRVDIPVYGFIIAACVVLSASPIVTFGDKVLFTIPLSEKLFDLWSVFRSSGRLVWPVIYLITVFALSVLLGRKKAWLVTLALALCAALQLYDLGGTLANRHAKYSAPAQTPEKIDAAFWDELGTAQEINHLVLSGDIANAWEGYLYPFARVAVKNKWTLNSFYFARHYDDIPDSWRQSLISPEEDMVFVLSPEEYEAFRMGASRTISFYEHDGMVIGLLHSQLLSLPALEREEGYTVTFVDGENMHNGEDINGIRHVHQNGISYGPYLAAAQGVYAVTFTGNHLDLGDVDVTWDAGNIQIPVYDLVKTPTRISYKITVDEPVSDLETRLFNYAEETVTISSITIVPVN